MDAVGYPKGEVSLSDGLTVFHVDGWELRAAEDHGRLVLSRSLGDASAEMLRALATLAAGRILREEAVLAWDPARRELFVWQAIASSAPAAALKLAFETFCTSAEWWAERCAGLAAPIPEMVIRG